ncbi:MAG: two-component system sensor histidine kinase YdfH [Roseiflexaceae bacterium]
MAAKRNFSSIPFYGFISILLGVLAGSAVWSIWQAGMPEMALLIAGLFLIHMLSYWLNLRYQEQPFWQRCYLPLQSTMMVVLALLVARYAAGSHLSLIGSMAICLIGEALGMWGNTRQALLIGLWYTALALFLLFVATPWEGFVIALANLAINGGFIVLLMVIFNQQLAERQRALDLAESLESANAKLAASAAKIEVLTLQNERQRMARELHDTLAQGLIGLTLQLEAAKAHLEANRTERARGIIEQALGRARHTLAESRAVIDDLRTTALSLNEAIREQAERFRQATGIDCCLMLSDDLPLTGAQIGQIIPVVGEALANIARHAQAQHVQISSQIDHALHLTIRDDGQGFDPAQPIAAGHYGLIGMRERTRILGGSVQIESSPQGTLIRLSIPLVQQQVAA